MSDLLSDPNSLVTKVFKARYFPHCSFLYARIGSNPSYVWRSILASQELIRMGARKRIGIGSNTKIWGEPWQPDPINPFIDSECVQDLHSATVNSLRVAETYNWNTDLLKELFNLRDQNLIMSIPLSRRYCDDKWMWGADKMGLYTVKSGYKLLFRNNDVDPNSRTVNWNSIWKFHVPPKVRNFLWRTFSSCLPTLVALQRRSNEVSEWCPLCRNEPEDDFHILISCPSARRVWRLTSLGSHVGSERSVAGWWNNLIATKSQSEVELAAVVLWSLWQNRNAVVWSAKLTSETSIFQTAFDTLSQWKAARLLPLHQQASLRHQRQEALIHWTPPPITFLKCNTDAAVFTSKCQSGYGCIIRDHQGSIVATMQGILHGITNPSISEPLGIREALSWIKDLHFSHIIFESNALLIIDALNSPNSDSSYIGLVIEDCKILALDIQSCSFVFVKRSANHAAHLLARGVDSLSGLEGRVSLSSSDISDVICTDLA